jgi:tetrapyrrole methylase family protein/MazG family protein
MERSGDFQELYAIVKRLRDPEEGCPWDRKQTVQSLKPFLLEEVYECFEAIDDGDFEHLREELGDVFMLAAMIAYMVEQQGGFTVSDVFGEVNAKLIRRHPHVFGDVQLTTSEEVIGQWDAIKENVEGRNKVDSVLQKVPRNLPPLERAFQLQQRASKAGFDWTRIEDVLAKVKEEIAELEEAPADSQQIEEEFGDLMFSMVNLSRYLKIDPSVALHRANTKFTKRFTYVEDEMRKRGSELKVENMPEMDALWDEAKERE